MPDFDNNGTTLHYELIGSGPPLLCLAGIASDGASWASLTQPLGERFRLILPDNRGSGRTRSEGPLSIDEMVSDCVALLDRLNIEQTDVLGHSMGGMLGQRLAASHPDRVRRLVTLSAADHIGMKERLLFEELERLYFELPPQRWFALLFQWLFSEPFFADPAAVNTAAEASTAYPYRQSPADFSRQVAALKVLPPVDISKIAAPILAIAAERDQLMPPERIAKAYAPAPDHRVTLIRDAGHSVHWEASAAVAAAVLDFLG